MVIFSGSYIVCLRAREYSCFSVRNIHNLSLELEIVSHTISAAWDNLIYYEIII